MIIFSIVTESNATSSPRPSNNQSSAIILPQNQGCVDLYINTFLKNKEILKTSEQQLKWTIPNFDSMSLIIYYNIPPKCEDV